MSPGPHPTMAAEWNWEGNVQAAVARWLVSQGWDEPVVSNTGMHEHGADMRTQLGDRVLIVEVKGWPSALYARGPKAGTPKRASMARRQGRHWFAEALLEAMIRRQLWPDAEVTIVFADHQFYRQRVKATGVVTSRSGLRRVVRSREPECRRSPTRGTSP